MERRTGRDGPETVAGALARIADTLTPREKRAADHLAEHYPVAGLAPMARFAKAAGASSQTVLRLVAKLGCASWRDVQERLKAELAGERGSPLGRWTAHRTAVAREGDWLENFGVTLAANVGATFRDLSRPEFEEAARRMADPRRRVLVVGGRFSQALARLLARHLEVVRGDVEELGSQSSTWPDRLIDVGRRTVLVAYDVRRYQQDVVRVCGVAREQGASVVLLTDDRTAPAAAYAHATLVGAMESAGAWDSFGGLLALTEALVARVAELAGGATDARLGRLEQIRERLLGEG